MLVIFGRGAAKYLWSLKVELGTGTEVASKVILHLGPLNCSFVRVACAREMGTLHTCSVWWVVAKAPNLLRKRAGAWAGKVVREHSQRASIGFGLCAFVSLFWA